MPNYPASLDTTGAGTLPSNYTDGASNIIHAADIDNHSLTIVSLEAKVGFGASTPTNGLILVGGVTAGSSAWQTPVGGPPTGSASGGTSDLTGTYPQPTVARVNGVAVTGTPVAGQVPTATGPTAATWQSPTGSGTINGVVVTGTPSTGQVPTATGSSTATWQTPAAGGGAAAAGVDDPWVYAYRLRTMIDSTWAIPTPPPLSTGLSPKLFSAIQTLITAAGSGGTVTIPDGIYYPDTQATVLTCANPVTLVAQNPGRVSIRGAMDWSTSGTAGNTWTNTTTSGITGYLSALTVPTFTTSTSSATPSNTFTYYNRDMVFIDGVMQTHVSATNVQNPAGVTPATGQYTMVNYGTDRRIILGTNPAGHLIEVVIAQRFFAPMNQSLPTQTINLDGIDFRYAAASYNNGYAIEMGYSNGYVRNCTFRDMYGSMLSYGPTPGPVQIYNNWFYNSGCSGIQLSGAFANIRVMRNWFVQTSTTWCGINTADSSGAVKAAGSGTNLLFEENFVNQCYGQGLWTDIDIQFTTWRRNVCWDNLGSGIVAEISENCLIEDNIVIRTPNWTWTSGSYPAGAIYSSTSRFVEIRRNFVFGFTRDIYITWLGTTRTSDKPVGGCYQVTCHDNTVIGRQSVADNGGNGDSLVNWSSEAPGTDFATANLIGGWNNLYGAKGQWLNPTTTRTWNYLETIYPWYHSSTSEYQMATWRTTQFENGTGAPTGTPASTTRYLTEAESVGLMLELGLSPAAR